MSLWSRVANVFRGDRPIYEIDEELQSHLDDAVAHGRDAAEARRAFGSTLRAREESRDQKLLPWLDSLRADAVFGWRRLRKNSVTSAAAILSLALAIGACTAAFRLIDAILLRPLPVAHADRLYVAAYAGTGADKKTMTYDSSSYPMFARMRDELTEQAELFAVSYADRLDITYGSDQEMEKAYWQFVSGSMFPALGLNPAMGRLLTSADDETPGKHPYAVISHEYWSRRFGRDPGVVGRKLRAGDTLYEIVGVAPEGFTGTETGTMTGIFVPMAMKNPQTLASYNNFWLRAMVLLKPGVRPEPVHARMIAVFHAIQEERAKQWAGAMPQQLTALFKERLLLEGAPGGRSNIQREYRQPLVALGVLVALVLLIACGNVANLMTVQAASRSREMALRVSIGAGRRRLVQMVLVEGALMALMAALLGAALAWQSAPLVLRMISTPDSPAQLALPADGRVFAFGAALTLCVTLMFGLAPALRASGVKPFLALKGGEDPHARRRLMHALIAVQVAFCFLVLFVAGLFVATFDRVTHQPLGYSAERIVNLETVTHTPQPAALWDQVADRLRALPGVETVAMTTWPLMSGESNIGAVSVNGTTFPMLSNILKISPGWFETMKVPLIDGRDFRADDVGPGVAIVNEAFAKEYFAGSNPTGSWFNILFNKDDQRVQIVGYVRDARTRDDLRLTIRPILYIPLHGADARRGTFVVRTTNANPLALASILRQEVPRARPEFRVSNIRSQAEIIQSKTVRERLLAMLALFFAGVALLLAGIGLYGVLDYSVLQRRREIGIRMAIGARPAGIARLVTRDVLGMVLAGALAGLALGLAAVRYLDALFYQVKPTDVSMLALPSIVLLAAAMVAALPAVIHAVRVNPVEMLRSE
jgi:predicted permease